MSATKMYMEDKNPHKLEVGKKYWTKYLPSNDRWRLSTITRFTDDGTPWAESYDQGQRKAGIVSWGMYDGKPMYVIQPYFEIPVEQFKEVYMKALKKLNNMNDAELMDFIQ